MINIDIDILHYNAPNESYKFLVKFCSNSTNSIVAGAPTIRSTRYGTFGGPLSAIIIQNSLRKLEFSFSDYRSFQLATYDDRSDMLLLSRFPWRHSSQLVFMCSCTINLPIANCILKYRSQNNVKLPMPRSTDLYRPLDHAS